MASNPFAHEVAYRGDDYLDRLDRSQIVVCGAGALGSNVVDMLTRMGVGTRKTSIRVIDFDRVDAGNIATQVYAETDVGQLKVVALKNRIFRTNRAEIEAVQTCLDSSNAAKVIGKATSLRGRCVILDCFDNAASRNVVQTYCRAYKLACIHAGLSGDSYGEVVHDSAYRVPKDTGDDPCDVPLSRTLAVLTTAVMVEEILDFLLEGTPRMASWTITLKDLCIKRMG